jgi:hypothetical protein
VCLLRELTYLVVRGKRLLTGALEEGVQVALDWREPVAHSLALLRREVTRIHAGECSRYDPTYTIPQLGGSTRLCFISM